MDDEFEFYPCLVDGAPASIYVNLKYEHAPVGDTRYTVAIAMKDRGEHGIGTADEAVALDVVEQAVIGRATEHAIVYAGRLRTRGIWETVLYGPPGHLDSIREMAIARAGTRRLDVRSEADPAWSYYRELLLPDEERRQWMDDRRMVQILAEQGDRLTPPRRIDHQLSFPTAEAARAFSSALPEGFTLAAVTDDLVQVTREDPIELEHIHDVVMLLVDSAAKHGGHYERWEAGIIS